MYVLIHTIAHIHIVIYTCHIHSRYVALLQMNMMRVCAHMCVCVCAIVRTRALVLLGLSQTSEASGIAK